MVKKNRPIARSFINFIWAILFSLLNYITFSIIKIYISDYYIDLLYLMLYYLIISYTVTYLQLCEDGIKIVYIFKLFRRLKQFRYEEIEKVKLVNYIHAYEYPRIRIIFKGKSKIEWPSNTFQVYTYKQRRKILKIFDSKGVQIEIKSDIQKEINMLS